MFKPKWQYMCMGTTSVNRHGTTRKWGFCEATTCSKNVNFWFKVNVKKPKHLQNVCQDSKQRCLNLVERPICNAAECKMQFTGQRLQYKICPNVITVFTQKSHAKANALIFFVENLTWLLLRFLFQTQIGFHIPLMVIAHHYGFKTIRKGFDHFLLLMTFWHRG